MLLVRPGRCGGVPRQSGLVSLLATSEALLEVVANVLGANGGRVLALQPWNKATAGRGGEQRQNGDS